MALETWVALGAGGLLAIAAVARWLALRKGPGRWDLLATGARLGAAVTLVVAWAWLVGSRGGWSPSDLRQAALGLALAAVCVHLVLTWRLGVDGAGPVVDLVALVLILVAVFAIYSGKSPSPCAQRAIPFRLQWVLFVVGAGGIVVAGSAGLMLAFQALLTGRFVDLHLPHRTDLSACLRHATALGLIALGSGLTVNVWWAWRTLGSLTNGDPREVWMASAWLVAATSLLSWQLEEGPRRWAAGLSVAAAIVAVLGVLAWMDLRYLPGF